MIDITEFDNTNFVFTERKNDRRKNKDTGVGREFYVKRVSDGIITDRLVAGRNRRREDRRNTREVIDTEGTTLWTSDDVEVSDNAITEWRLR